MLARVAGVEKINCPFHDIDGPVEFTDEGWQDHACPTCRLLYISPRPTPEAVADIYKEDAAHGSAIMHLNHFGSSANKLGAARTLKVLRQHGSTGRVLEIGPGAGSFLIAAREAGYDVAAVELNPVQAAHIRDTLGIPCWESLDDVVGTFDVVYHCDVLSHFYEPVAAFEQIGGLLRSGGLHIFETGDGGIAPKYRPLIRNWQFPDHLFIFTEESLTALTDASGFERVETQRYSIAPLLRIKNVIDRLRGRKPPVSPLAAANAEAGPDPAPLVPTPATAAPVQRSGAKRVIIEALGYPFHFIRYEVGARAPKAGRPQTLIAVTRKV